LAAFSERLGRGCGFFHWLRQVARDLLGVASGPSKFSGRRGRAFLEDPFQGIGHRGCLSDPEPGELLDALANCRELASDFSLALHVTRVRPGWGAADPTARFLQCLAWEEMSMLLAIAVILFIAWALGFLAFHVAGGLIHLLIVLAVISLVVHLLRRPGVA
jgi:hypothetical protein